MYKILQLDLVVGIILDLGAKSEILILSTNPEHDNLNFDYLYFALTASSSRACSVELRQHTEVEL